MPGDLTPAERVRAYYEDLNSGDASSVSRHFTDDAVHYYTRLGPHEGGRTIADHAAWAHEHLNGRWVLEHAVEGDDEVVIEWTMTWRDPESGARRLDRGTEWFRFREGKIAEVRAYHHSGPRNRSGDLVGFDHAGRGHTTL